MSFHKIGNANSIIKTADKCVGDLNSIDASRVHSSYNRPYYSRSRL